MLDEAIGALYIGRFEYIWHRRTTSWKSNVSSKVTNFFFFLVRAHLSRVDTLKKKNGLNFVLRGYNVCF